MVRRFVQNKARPPTRRKDITLKIHEIDGTPDLERTIDGMIVRKRDVAMEIGGRVAERRTAQAHEARDVPVLDHRRVGIDVDRKIEEVGDERNGFAADRKTRRLQDIEALDDQNV